MMRILIRGAVLAAAALALALSGCVAVVDDSVEDAVEPPPGTNRATDWQDKYREYDRRLITADDSVWADADKNVGTWEFKHISNLGDTSTPASREYVNGGEDDYDEWYTYDGKLYLRSSYFGRNDAIYRYELSNDSLTLTDSKGVAVKFLKTTWKNLAPVIPQNPVRDSRLLADNDCDGKNECEEYLWAGKTGSELVKWYFKYDVNNKDGDYYAYIEKIDASNTRTYTRFDNWYTLNNKLYLINHMGAAVEYSYRFSNSNRTLTLGGTAFEKKTEDEVIVSLRPAVLNNAEFDPALSGAGGAGGDYVYWSNDSIPSFIGFEDEGIARYENEDGYWYLWWYTKNKNTLYLLNLFTGAAAKTYTYKITGRKLELTASGKTMTLYLYGDPRERDAKIALSGDSVWLSPEEDIALQPNSRGLRVYQNYGNDWSDNYYGAWYTSGDTLYTDEFGNRQWEYSVSEDGNTLTLDGKTWEKTVLPEDNNGGGGSGLVGDWQIVSVEYNGEVYNIPDDYKWFYSFTQSNDLVYTSFEKISNYWIADTSSERYIIKGNLVCVIYDGEEDCQQYSISGNNLTLNFSGESCYDYGDGEECESYSQTMTAVRGNVKSTRSSLGSSLKSRDPALNRTRWERPSSDPDCEWCGDERIEFLSSYYEYPKIYLSSDYGTTWYTEGGKLVLVSENQTVTLDYQLTGGTLRLKAPGKGWDTWTPYSYGYLGKSKSAVSSRRSPRGLLALLRRQGSGVK